MLARCHSADAAAPAPHKAPEGSAALPWALLVPHSWDRDWAGPAQGSLSWTGRHCVYLGVCCRHFSQPLFLHYRGSKHKTSSWKGKISLLNSLRALKWRCFSWRFLVWEIFPTKWPPGRHQIVGMGHSAGIHWQTEQGSSPRAHGEGMAQPCCFQMACAV